MLQTKILMNMPVTVEVADIFVLASVFDEVFAYFGDIDKKFSVYKEDSEISRINRGEIGVKDYSPEMKEVFNLSGETKKLTKGYFDIECSEGRYDPCGLVKGWAIYKAAQMLKNKGYKNFYVEAGGDTQVFGKNKQAQNWQIGIRNPFNQSEIIKVVALSDLGMATSGTYIRGQHIYNPYEKDKQILDIVSLTVVGPTVYEADRFATAAFAMGRGGIEFIENFPGLEGYMVDKDGIATMTSGFNQYMVT